MKDKLTRNLGLKVMAVIFSAVLWMIAKDINDPVTDQRYYNVPVQLVNTGSITSQNKTYRVLDGTDSIRVTISAPESVVQNISKENIVAKADLSKVDENQSVPIEVTLNYLDSDVESIRTDKERLLLEIEERKSEQLRIEVESIGTLPEGYVTGRVSMDTNTISISGPESAVAPVRRAVVDIFMDGVTSDVNMQTQIRLLDEEGNEVNNANLKKNIESVKVTVPILKTKSLPVSYQVTGTPKEGYVLTGNVSCVPSSVMVAGKESVLEEVSQIDIPASELDVAEAEENVVRTVDIRKYLPSGVNLADENFSGNVTLTAEIEGIRRKTISLTESAIPVLNVPEGWNGEILQGQNLRVVVRGLQRDISGVTEATLQPHVNVSSILDADGNLTAGEQEIVVNFIVPENVQQEATVRATIRMTHIAAKE